MSQITEYLSDYMQELDNYMNRLNRDGLSRKDRKLFLDLSNEYYDIFQKAEDFPNELLRGISEFNDNIANPSDEGKELAGRYKDNIVQHATDYINTSLRTDLQFGIFQRDAEILNLQREKVQMLQEMVDLDIKMGGQITKQTQEILDVQNCEILNGRVRELSLWEQTNPAQEITMYQEEMAQQGRTDKKEEMSMEKKRVVSKDELDQLLNNYFMESRSERGAKTLDLSNCIISNYVFKGDLSAVSFDHADLRYCEFRMTKAEQVSFQDAVLTGCKMTQAEFEHCSFNNADIRAAKVANSMFRGSSFNTADMRQCSIQNSVFYHTSFTDTRMRELSGSENIFHECGNLEDTVRLEAIPDMDREEAANYVSNLREMFNNAGYMYSWELAGADLENYVADFSIKISHDGKTVEEERYSALLDPDTYAISHIDTRRQGDSLIRMFMPEMNRMIMGNLQKIKEQEEPRVRLKFPYMTRATFMLVKNEIKRMGATFDPVRKEWYVKQGVGKETINHIRDYIEKHDEAIYLKLPFTEDARKFKQILEEIKENGARYNPVKKRWYITETMDRSKFFSYLPTSELLFWKERENHSVHEKLSGFKAEAEKQTDKREAGYRRKEAPELA